MHDPMVIFFAWILTPMLPAVVLFKIIPSDATASGPLFGLRWKLGGAFAGYAFVLLAANLFFISDLKNAVLAEEAAKQDADRTEHVAKLSASCLAASSASTAF